MPLRFSECCFMVAAFLFLCGTGHAQQIDSSEWIKTSWNPVFQGVDIAVGQADSPRIARAVAARIDTKAEGIRFYSTGRTTGEYKENKHETDRQTVPEFLLENKLQFAVNANFYHPFSEETMKTPGLSILLGLAVSRGELVSKNLANWPAFLVYKDNRVEVVEVKDDSAPPNGVDTAVSGISMLLKDGVVPAQADEEVHPRTGVGICKSRQYVYFVVIDGRQEGYSAGATRAETGQWLKFFGAWDAVNLDGGGSTTMVLGDREEKARILNVPVGQSNKRGTYRYNGNNIGVWAKPLYPTPL